jgi:hypothetical protein
VPIYTKNITSSAQIAPCNTELAQIKSGVSFSSLPPQMLPRGLRGFKLRRSRLPERRDLVNKAEHKKIPQIFIRRYTVFRAWQRPTLPEPCGSSTIGAGGLNGRVRDGNAWFPSAIITKRWLSCGPLPEAEVLKTVESLHSQN